MKSSPIISLMVGLLLCLSLVAAWLSVRYYFSLKELQDLQSQHYRLNRTLTAVQSLAGQCVQYSQRNPDLIPILERYKLQPGTNAPSVEAVPGVAPPIP